MGNADRKASPISGEFEITPSRIGKAARKGDLLSRTSQIPFSTPGWAPVSSHLQNIFRFCWRYRPVNRSVAVTYTTSFRPASWSTLDVEHARTPCSPPIDRPRNLNLFRFSLLDLHANPGSYSCFLFGPQRNLTVASIHAQDQTHQNVATT